MTGTRPAIFIPYAPFLFQATNLPADGGPTVLSIAGINNVAEGCYFKRPFLVKEIGFGINATIVAGTVLIRPYIDEVDQQASLSVTLTSAARHGEAEATAAVLVGVGSRLTVRYTSASLNPAGSADIGGWLLGEFR